ncbi:MAG TPA: hypothetical protein VKT77_09365 [Chthonomonadaceae bacterium]|nr:hypothetical protein [Chthonomonadaceae bacterium]
MKPLQWHEPAAYRRAKHYALERSNPWRSAGFAGVAFLVMLALRAMAQHGPDAHPPPWPQSVAVAAVLALVVAYALPALALLLPGSIVILSEKGVNNNVMAGRGWSIRFWAWDKIARAAIEPDTAGGRTYRTLALYDAGGGRLAALAIPDRLDAAEIDAFLSRYGNARLEVRR